MEQQSNQPENQGFSQPELGSEKDSAVNERNDQAMLEQTALAQNAESNRRAAEAAEEARKAIERASNPNLIQEVPKSEATNEASPADPLIEGIPDHLKNQE